MPKRSGYIASMVQTKSRSALWLFGVLACNTNGPDDGAGGATSNGGSAGAMTASQGGGTGYGGTRQSGGSTNGGRLSGGTANAGGASFGGSTAASGGSSASGGANGGTVNGGSVNGGARSNGGSANGGSANGGKASGGTSTGGGPDLGGAGGIEGCGDSATSSYDRMILCAEPVGYWAITGTAAGEPDLAGNGATGTYRGDPVTTTALPNQDSAAVFNGQNNYLSLPSRAAFSIPTTGYLTWEAWIRPSVLQFPNHSGGYVDWMGKCEEYAPSCEWEARLYNSTNSQDRCNRFSAYVFNPSAGLGSGADFQPTCGLIQAATWYHVVGAYSLHSQPAGCNDTAQYPGSIDIWVNGVKWNQSRHGQTGCMSQYQVVPKANASAILVGTMARDAWFAGGIGKLAIYDRLLSHSEVQAHYRAMTGKEPTGSCQNDCSF